MPATRLGETKRCLWGQARHAAPLPGHGDADRRLLPALGQPAAVLKGDVAPGGDFLAEVEGGEVGFGEPGDAFQGWPGLTYREIDEVDVLVAGSNTGELDAEGAAELSRLAGKVDVDAGGADQVDGDAGFLFDFTDRRFVRGLVWLDVAAGGQPAT